MDIAKVVTYEHVHELRVTYPNSDRYLGLLIGVRSTSSEASKAMMRKITNDQQVGSRAKQKRITAEVMERNELETTASCMAWWRWETGEESKPGAGDAEDCTYKGEKPELTMAIAVEVLDAVSFIYAQVKEASINVENFMGKGEKGSAST